MGSFFSFLDHLNMIEDDSSRYEVSVSEEGFSYLDLVSEKNARRLSFGRKAKSRNGGGVGWFNSGTRSIECQESGNDRS